MHVPNAGALADAPQDDADRVLVRERVPLPSEEERPRRLAAEAGDVVLQRLRSALTHADVALLLALAVDEHPPLLPVHVLQSHGETLSDSHPGVEQEEDQGVFAAAFEARAVLGVEQPARFVAAQRRVDLLLLRGVRDPGEDVLLDQAHPLAPGEEGPHLAVAVVLVAGRGAALPEVAEEGVDVVDSVLLDRFGEARVSADAAEVFERLRVTGDRPRGLALDLDRREVGGDGVVDPGLS